MINKKETQSELCKNKLYKIEFLKRRFWYKFGNFASLSFSIVGTGVFFLIFGACLVNKTANLPFAMQSSYLYVFGYFNPAFAFGLYGLFRYFWIRIMLTRYGISLFSDIDPKWLQKNYGYDIDKLEEVHFRQLRFCKLGAKTLLLTGSSLIVTYGFSNNGNIPIWIPLLIYIVVALWFFQFVIEYDARMYDVKCLTKEKRKEIQLAKCRERNNEHE